MEKDFNKGFSWDIKQNPIIDQETGLIIPGNKVIKRDDDNSVISVMKNSFTPITTSKFTEIVEEIAQNIGAEIAGYTDWGNGTTMGSSRQVITAQIKLTEALSIAGSKIQGYLTIGTGFDGNRSFYVGHTNQYLRCSNQWGSIITELTARLTKNVSNRVDEIIKNISLYTDYEQKIYENFRKFEKVKIDERIIQECIARIAGLSEEERAMTLAEREEELSTQKVNKMIDIEASLRGEVSDLGSNAWALFNGVTHYTTHVMKARTNESFGNLFGAKNTANQQAYDYALELLES